MQRRKYLAAIGSLAAGGAAAMGTGAFSSLSAGRVVTAHVVSDPNAFLALGALDERASISNNQLKINFNGSNHGADGLNPDARTTFHDLFKIKNQGDNQVAVAVGVNGEDVGQASPLSGESTQYEGDLLADQSGIDSVGVFAEEPGVGGDGLGANGSVKIGIDSGSRVWLNQAGQPNAVDSTQYLDPGESLNVDMIINTNENLAGPFDLDPGMVIMAVEPGSDRDATTWP